MRDPARIERILELLRVAWQAQPDTRLLQLLINAAGPDTMATDLFLLEDDRLEELIVGHTQEVTDRRADRSQQRLDRLAAFNLEESARREFESRPHNNVHPKTKEKIVPVWDEQHEDTKQAFRDLVQRRSDALDEIARLDQEMGLI